MTDPAFEKQSFRCPHCNVVARQYRWGYPPNTQNANHIPWGHPNLNKTFARLSLCENCSKPAIWAESILVWPDKGTAPPANNAMPADVKADYLEASRILSRSPRGSAALLRLAIQKLCVDLGEKGKNLNDDIESLVKKGLPSQVQQALDVVRVVGNNAVHPGLIDAADEDVASKLFPLVNLIVEYMIELPIRVGAIYTDVLPETAREAIDKRDGGPEKS